MTGNLDKLSQCETFMLSDKGMDSISVWETWVWFLVRNIKTSMWLILSNFILGMRENIIQAIFVICIFPVNSHSWKQTLVSFQILQLSFNKGANGMISKTELLFEIYFHIFYSLIKKQWPNIADTILFCTRCTSETRLFRIWFATSSILCCVNNT